MNEGWGWFLIPACSCSSSASKFRSVHCCTQIQKRFSATETVLSAISVVELEHGYYRAQTTRQATERCHYLDVVFAAIPVEPFTREIGQMVARIDAEARRQGMVIPFADLLIGGMALHFGYELVTLNERHFRMIPNLSVCSF